MAALATKRSVSRPLSSSSRTALRRPRVGPAAGRRPGPGKPGGVMRSGGRGAPRGTSETRAGRWPDLRGTCMPRHAADAQCTAAGGTCPRQGRAGRTAGAVPRSAACRLGWCGREEFGRTSTCRRTSRARAGSASAPRPAARRRSANCSPCSLESCSSPNSRIWGRPAAALEFAAGRCHGGGDRRGKRQRSRG